ncbi:hypothetical protein GGI05_004695 [Coemansia sp. RSA 2603]|nr:hypothetical protein GGI05_004695 [Coemansia sp. RSA 2603]
MSSLPSRRPRHQQSRRRRLVTPTYRNSSSHNNPRANVGDTGWLCMPCLPQDIIESVHYEPTIVGRSATPRQPCPFTESQAMGLALILAEQYVRAADPCPLSQSQMPLEKIDESSDGFVETSWSPNPQNDDSRESLMPASTVSPTCSPHPSERSCNSPVQQRSSRHFGFLTLPLRSTRTRTASSSGSTVIDSSLLSINNTVSSSKTGAKFGYGQLRRPAQWIRSLFS